MKSWNFLTRRITFVGPLFATSAMVWNWADATSHVCYGLDVPWNFQLLQLHTSRVNTILEFTPHALSSCITARCNRQRLQQGVNQVIRRDGIAQRFTSSLSLCFVFQEFAWAEANHSRRQPAFRAFQNMILKPCGWVDEKRCSLKWRKFRCETLVEEIRRQTLRLINPAFLSQHSAICVWYRNRRRVGRLHSILKDRDFDTFLLAVLDWQAVIIADTKCA